MVHNLSVSLTDCGAQRTLTVRHIVVHNLSVSMADCETQRTLYEEHIVVHNLESDMDVLWGTMCAVLRGTFLKTNF